jgi:hypothetical protein
MKLYLNNIKLYLLSWNCYYSIWLRTGHDARPGQEIFLFSKTSKLAGTPTHPAIQKVLEVHRKGVK